MNLPNKLTIFRVILIPFFVVAMLWDKVPYGNYIAVGIFVVACLTDFLDGQIARRYNLITTFGKFMDPLADKLLVSAALICFLEDPESVMPVWVVIVIISRDLIINGIRLVAAEKGVTIAADYFGKVKTTVQMVMSILLILNFRMPAYVIVEYIFIYAAVILTVISLIDCLYKNRDVLKDVN